MRYITADYLLMLDGKFYTGKALAFDMEGRLADIADLSQVKDPERHRGILTPGFINTHCHLELSYMKDKVRPATGLPGFVRDFIGLRGNDESSAVKAAQLADARMWESGVQAVGDICNRDHTLAVKTLSRIRYFNFIETFGLDSHKAESQYRNAVGLCDTFEQQSQEAAVTAHAAYSMSPLLLDLIRVHHPLDMPWSVHNQESDDELQLFVGRTGKFAELFNSLGIDISSLPDDVSGSLQYLLRYVPSTGNRLFVHNTYTSKSDIELMRDSGMLSRSWFALCPKANLFIENRLPDIAMLHNEGCKITLGTDSLASNDELNIIGEIKAIHQKHPSIPAATILTWATKNGAEFFNWNDLGSFTKGTFPGCVLIETDQPTNIASWKCSIRLL